MKWLLYLPIFCFAYSPFLEKFERSFTLLEIGNETSLSYASRYPTSVFVVWSRSKDEVKNSVILEEKVTKEKIKHLSDCEHFDIVVVDELSKEICSLGDYYIIPYEKRNLKRVMQTFHLTSPIIYGNKVVLASKKKFLLRKFWVRKRDKTFLYKIKANFKKKQLYKYGHDMAGKEAISDWIPGINLVTFKMLRGSYPPLETIENELIKLQAIDHPDWMINNMLVCGNRLVFIDFNDPRRSIPYPCSSARLQYHLDLMREKDLDRFSDRLNQGFRDK